MRTTTSIITAIVALVAFLVFLQYIGFSWKTSLVTESCQPPEINYEPSAVDEPRYCASLYKKYHVATRSYVLRVGVPARGSYGYETFYPIQGSYVEQSGLYATWSAAGVEIRAENVPTLFISTDDFVGGR